MIRIATYRWRAEGPLRAVLIQIHGLNSFSDAMAVIPKHIASSGIEVVSLDLRNFGRSESPMRGNFGNIDPIVNDCATFFNHVKATYPNVPIFVLGQSLGGLLALRMSFVFGDQIRGLVLLAPLVRMQNKMVNNGFMKGSMMALSGLFGGIPLPKPKENLAFRVPAAHAYINENPLYFTGSLQLRTITSMIRATELLTRNFSRISQPLLIFRAGQEKLVDNQAIQDLHDQCSTSDKQIYDYPDCWHAVTRDPDIFEIIPQIRDWILERSAS